jgi:hypothetical protein
VTYCNDIGDIAQESPAGSTFSHEFHQRCDVSVLHGESSDQRNVCHVPAVCERPARFLQHCNRSRIGSVFVRDEEWLVTKVESATDGYFVDVVGLSELVRDTEATFTTGIDTIVEADPTKVTVVADDSPQYRRSRLWLEAMLRKTPMQNGNNSSRR